MREWWRLTTIGRAARILTKSERRKVLAVALLQIVFGILDLLGVAAVGMLGALAISGVESQSPGNRVSDVLRVIGLSEMPLQTQVAVIGALAATLLISKTVFSIIFSRKIVFFLSRRGARISSMLVDKLLSKSILVIQSRSHQQTVYAITSGIEAITMGILYTAVSIVSDTSLLIILSLGLFIVDPTVAVSTFLLFGAIGLFLYRIMHIKAGELGALQGALSVESNQKILEVLDTYREAVVSNRRNYYARRIGLIRLNMANTTAELTFMPNVSKYVIEVSVILGSLIIAATQFLLHEAGHAVAVLAVFLATSTRVAPAVLRLQQGALKIRGSMGVAESTLIMVEELAWTDSTQEVSDVVKTTHEGFESSVQLCDVQITYPGKNNPAVKGFNLRVDPGQIIAIVGPSGAGKTSVVDILLGVLDPDEGVVTISGAPPLLAESKWPGAIAYVPQDTVITGGTIRENVGMGFPSNQISDELVWSALKIAQLDKFVEALPNGIETEVGDRGATISGGQRQRLGIARAMFTKPKLLVLDEATSSLDGETEAHVSQAIHKLKGEVTVILIAHRLSTVRKADLVVYMHEGMIQATGTFDDVRKLVPDFDHQAQLMGL